MKKVLIPVDGSTHALRAVRFVVRRMRRRGGCHICLLTVQESAAPALAAAPVEDYDEKKACMAVAAATAMLDQAGLPYDAGVRIGGVAESIRRYAAQRQCDHIVMGTRGAGSAPGPMGAVAATVMRIVPVPVTLVH
ncbi:universal stress protein [Achromobacter sp. Marseille-Q4962]|jgi:nucleotide-binding universal stress UspA family protein|uniref:universal stress protein n=1 Tax=Achromobacter sp. Marseille-Q4962 TaxID=2942202 RepID=UPI00207497F3|nr:universal stress protein [Achromobacter sp. Marseille-Q4962]